MPNWTGLVRLLRRRLVLGIIFGLSLAYCAISLLSHEKLENSLRGTREGASGELSDDRDAPLVDYNENGDEEAFRGSAKNLAWHLPPENNYEAGNDDTGDTNRDSLDANGTFVVARMCRNSIQSECHGRGKHDARETRVERIQDFARQGKALIVDERGYVCSRSELLSTGCCGALEKTREESHDVESPLNQRRKRYSCETCNPQGCCAVYEYCVSCCLQPGKVSGVSSSRRRMCGARSCKSGNSCGRLMKPICTLHRVTDRKCYTLCPFQI